MKVQGDGRIVLLGTTMHWWRDPDTGDPRQAADLALARYTSNGALDTSFNGNGMVTIDLGGMDDRVLGATIQPDGRILVFGVMTSTEHGDVHIVLTHLGASGSLDPDFGAGGMVLTGPLNESVHDLALQPDGKIVVVGERLLPPIPTIHSRQRNPACGAAVQP